MCEMIFIYSKHVEKKRVFYDIDVAKTCKKLTIHFFIQQVFVVSPLWLEILLHLKRGIRSETVHRLGGGGGTRL